MTGMGPVEWGRVGHLPPVRVIPQEFGTNFCREEIAVQEQEEPSLLILSQMIKTGVGMAWKPHPHRVAAASGIHAVQTDLKLGYFQRHDLQMQQSVYS